MKQGGAGRLLRLNMVRTHTSSWLITVCHLSQHARAHSA
jgi:hypothetical protein